MDTEWMDENEAAEWLKVPVDVVRDAVKCGDLPSLKIGGYVRISRVALRDLALLSGKNPGRQEVRTGSPGSIPVPEGLVWTGNLTPSEPFEHDWPRKGGGKLQELYHSAWKGEVRLYDQLVTVRVGQHTRDGKERLSVLFGETPICEFAETTDRTGWASIVKPDSKRVLTAGEKPPALYRGTKLVSYREATGLKGTGVPNGVSVVIDRDQLASAVHHAVARRLARRNLPVVAAAE